MALFGPPNVEKLRTKGDVSGLAQALNYPKDPAIRKAAAEALAELAERAAIQPLQGALQDADAAVRLAAITALGRIGSDGDLEPLIGFLARGDSPARSAAMSVLIEKAGSLIFARLLKLARDARSPAAAREGSVAVLRATQARSLPSLTRRSSLPFGPILMLQPALDPRFMVALAEIYGPLARQHFIEALGAPVAWDPADGEALLSTLRDLIAFARCAPAFGALSALGLTTLTEIAGKILDEKSEAAAFLAGPALKRVASLLGVSDAGSVGQLRSAAEKLLSAKTPGAMLGCLPKVQTLLSASTTRLLLKRQAMAAIGVTRDQESAPALAAHLAFSPAYHSNDLAQLILRDLGEASVADTVAAALWDGHVETLVAAAGALGQVGGAQALTALSTCAADKKVPLAVRRSATAALGALGSGDAVSAISAYLGHSDLSLEDRRGAIACLGKIRDKRSAVVLLKAMESADLRAAAVEALKQNEVGAVLSKLLTLLKHEEAAVRAAAAEALGSAALKEVEKALAGALLDTNKAVRVAAAGALAKLGWQPGSDEAAAALAIARGETSDCPGRYGEHALQPLSAALRFDEPQDRIEAAQALGTMRQPQAADPLLALAKSEWWYDRKAAFAALSEMGDKRAVGVLVKELAAGGLELEAAAALVRLGAAGATPPVAIERQVRLLTAEDRSTRQRAAEILAVLYRSQQLSEQLAREVLNHRQAIVRPHSDHDTHEDRHEDRGERCTYEHSDGPISLLMHHDLGIGVAL